MFFPQSNIIVSKTDLKGRITYANQWFLDISGHSNANVVGAHSIIRHPDMPRAILKLVWDTLGQGREIFAFVKNTTKRGDPYRVFAHVKPSRDGSGRVVGYHSNRRVPNRDRLERVFMPLYANLNRIEREHANAKQGLAASSQFLADTPTEGASAMTNLSSRLKAPAGAATAAPCALAAVWLTLLDLPGAALVAGGGAAAASAWWCVRIVRFVRTLDDVICAITPVTSRRASRPRARAASPTSSPMTPTT